MTDPQPPPGSNGSTNDFSNTYNTLNASNNCSAQEPRPRTQQQSRPGHERLGGNDSNDFQNTLNADNFPEPSTPPRNTAKYQLQGSNKPQKQPREPSTPPRNTVNHQQQGTYAPLKQLLTPAQKQEERERQWQEQGRRWNEQQINNAHVATTSTTNWKNPISAK